jgi:protein transport protein SEC61 subunit gamma and related proteins
LDIIKSIRGFLSDSKRVLDISYKPDMGTFQRTVKIVLIGTLILGVLGFIIATIIGVIT